MWFVTFEPLQIFLSVICCAGAIKLLDDYLDQEIDNITGKINWGNKLGSGTPVYAMLLLVVSLAFNCQVGGSLFLASYTVGMFNDLKSHFPSGLKGWQESVLVCGSGILLFGIIQMLFSLFFIFAVQLIDDCLDISADNQTGQRNLAVKFGFPESIVLALLSLLISSWLREKVFLPAFFSTTLVYCFLSYKER
jgi:4-hydroxybenzoate polyprenyltransferase